MTTHRRGARLRLVYSRRELEPGDNIEPVPDADPLVAHFRELLRRIEGRRPEPDDEPPPDAA